MVIYRVAKCELLQMVVKAGWNYTPLDKGMCRVQHFTDLCKCTECISGGRGHGETHNSSNSWGAWQAPLVPTALVAGAKRIPRGARCMSPIGQELLEHVMKTWMSCSA